MCVSWSKKRQGSSNYYFHFFVFYFDMRQSLMTWKRLFAGLGYSDQCSEENQRTNILVIIIVELSRAVTLVLNQY